MKTVLIFGGAKGIGAAISELFNKQGYAVALTYNTSEDAAVNLVNKLNESGNAACYKADVTDYKQVESAVAATLKKYKKIDCLVCCAGVSLVSTLFDTTEQDFEHTISVNQKGVFNCCKAAAKSMVDRQSGNIVIISSIAGTDGISCESVYSMTKGGLIAFAKSLAKELGESGIRVNCVCPGLIDTAMNDNLSTEEKAQLIDGSLVKRIGLPADVAKAVYFAAENEYFTAECIHVNGGIKL